ncbi:DUF4767 domain-containing protein [Lacticaseibacillus absianus]|uniref:DUF4767 domain-containing protein n=1 Tax=Lacticaseibacillus absianus TaxID=2729623 RepID=UPI0015CB07DD|nr:DUF4767 domain-containing protein [Lacticaseibacillus absianus]
MIKYGQLAAALVIGVTLLSGCGQRASEDATKSSGATTKQSARTKSTTSSKRSASSKATSASQAAPRKQTTLWDQSKDEQLAQFITQWAPTMGQVYARYDGQHPLEVSTGVTYPTGLAQQLVSGQSGQIGMSTDGKGSNAYNIVAIYNYDQTEPPLPGRITYFFGFHNGQPVVLADQSRDGQPNAGPTQNTAIRDGFTRIAASTTPAKPKGLAQSRATITQQEQQNHNMPLDFEPVHNADQAIKLVASKYGNKQWVAVHGTAGVSAPITFTVSVDGGSEAYLVYATGVIAPFQ